MDKLLLLFAFFVLISCSKKDKEESDIEVFKPEYQQYFVTDRSGREYPLLDPKVVSYCGAGWGRKFCRFLYKYDGTTWTDAENYYSDFPDINFSNFSDNDYFLSFFHLDSITSYCEGWKLGETSRNGMKWNIKIRRDQEDALWFDYDYYGSSDKVEYTIRYKYEVIDGLLNFSSSEGQTFIYSPSEKTYSEGLIETGDVIRLQGCLFR